MRDPQASDLRKTTAHFRCVPTRRRLGVVRNPQVEVVSFDLGFDGSAPGSTRSCAMAATVRCAHAICRRRALGARPRGGCESGSSDGGSAALPARRWSLAPSRSRSGVLGSRSRDRGRGGQDRARACPVTARPLCMLAILEARGPSVGCAIGPMTSECLLAAATANGPRARSTGDALRRPQPSPRIARPEEVMP
jgi:hypothetical protein